MKVHDISEMVGVTMRAVEGSAGSDLLTFDAEDGRRFEFTHIQDCCESVYIEDVCGDLDDLVGTPIVLAEEVTNADEPEPPTKYADSYTWTFYRFATAKGAVTVRWFGESNRYYSESVSFVVLSAKSS